MELLLFKTESQVLQDGISRLEKTVFSEGGTPGKVCRLLLNIINSIIAGENGLYDSLKLNHLNAFISTATSDGLDAIGNMVNISRKIYETDEQLRYRINQSMLSMATANEASIKLAALSIEGVQSVSIKEFAFGTGSYAIYIITDTAYPSQSIIDNVKVAVDKVRAYGSRFDILSPIIKDVKMNVILSFVTGTTDAEKSYIYTSTKSSIVSSINTRDMGAILDIELIINNIISSNKSVKNATVSTLFVDDRPVFVTNQECRWNQRFLASSADGAIIVQGAI